MSVIASALKHMLAAGMPADAIVAAVAEMEANLAHDPVAEKRRAYDRERKRIAKQNRSTGIPPESAENAEQLLDKEKSPTPPKEINPPSGDKSPSGKPRPRKADDFELPERIPAEPWAEFVTMRRRMGKPLTPRAKQLAVEKLDELATAGWPPGEVLNNSILNSYQGLFPPKENRNGTRNHNPAAGRPTVSDALHAARGRLGYS